jgi:hypothetical protein
MMSLVLGRVMGDIEHPQLLGNALLTELQRDRYVLQRWNR